LPDKQVAMRRVANNERREQALTADEPRSRLPFWGKGIVHENANRVNQQLFTPGKAAQAATQNQGALDIKWYIFTPVILVHFYRVDNIC
jgi:hypothetical protein